MAGNVKRHRLGLVPRGSLRFLLKPTVVAFNERHSVFIRSLIAFKIFTWKLRSFVAYLLKKIMRDPIAIYRVGKRYTYRYLILLHTVLYQWFEIFIQGEAEPPI